MYEPNSEGDQQPLNSRYNITALNRLRMPVSYVAVLTMRTQESIFGGSGELAEGRWLLRISQDEPYSQFWRVMANQR